VSEIPTSPGNASSYADADYVAGVQRGDEAVFTALVHTYLDALTRFAFSFLGDEDAAHDIVQDVFARVWQLGADWNPTGSVSAYFFVSVRHRALNVLRHGQAQARANESLRAYLETVERDADPYSDVALARLVSQGILSLTDRQRDALRLRYGQGQTMPKVAEVLGIDVKAAERLVSRALTALRSRLAGVRKELE
jgi:RNA polymerase sigma-70 factor (ECF subfamily)